jgi:hypothetical protein
LITELQLNYVDEANRTPAPAGETPVVEEAKAATDEGSEPEVKEASA